MPDGLPGGRRCEQRGLSGEHLAAGPRQVAECGPGGGLLPWAVLSIYLVS